MKTIHDQNKNNNLNSNFENCKETAVKIILTIDWQ